ncbi:uncharacterized protein LOC141914891 [Tubulanus polymorphus]|uniref:uncharacterized protein LOC141914891 n=1 Tax=Tubulanus polymorphus TaxID=672921 RepID=UPI003DA500ED
MLATSSSPHQFTGLSRTLKADINEVIGSGKHYVTPELEREFRSINNGVEHLKLDSTLHGGNSTLLQQRSGAVQTLNNANGVMNNYKLTMDKNNLAKMQENEIRELHHHHMQNLLNVKGDMRPYAKESYNRIRQFSDQIGVTDRYTGYRNNLTRGSRNPFQLDTYWMRDFNKNKPVFNSDGYPRAMTAAGYHNTFNQYTMSNKPNRQPDIGIQSQLIRPATTQSAVPVKKLETRGQHLDKGPNTQSIQEACGINMIFPGKSEYKTRYSRPPPDEKTSPFIINPAPNYHIYGRPLAKQQFDPSYTEYQTRYEWPDGSKIIKLPWLKK